MKNYSTESGRDRNSDHVNTFLRVPRVLTIFTQSLLCYIYIKLCKEKTSSLKAKLLQNLLFQLQNIHNSQNYVVHPPGNRILKV